ncbi:MAG TPA: hypothetical protein VFX70_06855, partial [Mycobacteriales bacterium]|nr:hypothetical protein [Mycobacteriales bacterium]
TAVLAALLYLFHTTAALLAALPPVARVEPAVLVRWYGHAAGVLVLAEAVGLAMSLAGRVTGGILVDLVGLAGVVVLAGVPVLLARRAAGRPDRRRAGES